MKGADVRGVGTWGRAQRTARETVGPWARYGAGSSAACSSAQRAPGCRPRCASVPWNPPRRGWRSGGGGGASATTEPPAQLPTTEPPQAPVAACLPRRPPTARRPAAEAAAPWRGGAPYANGGRCRRLHPHSVSESARATARRPRGRAALAAHGVVTRARSSRARAALRAAAPKERTIRKSGASSAESQRAAAVPRTCRAALLHVSCGAAAGGGQGSGERGGIGARCAVAPARTHA
jgi:hypothetical protein